ncbi:MAG: DUF1285 domain-containing protein [Alphaproteobacteria bacterium]|nr:DUF1285 domain-containing protein [Alphaproteobacteria bacterium]
MSSPSEPLKGLQEVGRAKGPPPVHLWNPPFCGDIPMRVGRDGLWHYMNSPIGRLPLVKLFSSVLRLDEDGKYYLVTPVEKCGIVVEDAPFFAVRMRAEGAGRGQVIHLETQVEEEVQVGPEHPLRFVDEEGTGGLKPYVLVRRNLEALVSRALFYDLVALGCVEGEWFGVWSSGQFFPMKKAADAGL